MYEGHRQMHNFFTDFLNPFLNTIVNHNLIVSFVVFSFKMQNSQQLFSLCKQGAVS